MRTASPVTLFCWLAALAAAVHVPASARIVGGNNRAPLPTELEAPFSGVGRIVCRDPASGNRFSSTATLVGDRSTLLAVGHFRRTQSPDYKAVIPIDYCAFELRSADGTRLFGSMLAPHPVARFSPREQPSPLTPDWAILKLRTPAPESVLPARVQPMKADELARRSDAFLVGYHSFPEEAANRKQHSPQCKPLAVRDAPLVFSHSCDTELGSSGGLVYVNTPQGPRAVGMNHGSAIERNYGQIIGGELLRHLPKEAVAGSR